MAIFKRGRTWWTDFSVNGVRYRESLGTTDWREAQRQEKKLIAQAEAGKVTRPGRALARLAFCVAIERYLTLRQPRLARKTILTERERSKPLVAYFASRTVQSIGTDDVLDYIAERNRAGVSNATINRERDLLRGVLVKAQCWHLLETDELRPLKVEGHIGRALSFTEKLQLLKTAESKPEWQIARLAAALALNTTMRAGEIRNVRWRDVDVINKVLTVRRSKTCFDKKCKADIGKIVSPTAGLRFHDLRHHAIYRACRRSGQ